MFASVYKERAQSLLGADVALKNVSIKRQRQARKKQVFGEGSQLMDQAGLSLPFYLFCGAACVGALGAALLAAQIMAPLATPFVFLGTLYMLWGWLDSKIDARVQEFAKDYPALLLATSSSIKVGHTADVALERATQLMPKNGLVRKEVEEFLKNIKDGMHKQEAIELFAKDIRLPDVELFRSAYLLVTENGGKFGPTLERLAAVTKDRLTLIQEAGVSTATMRMTANILLLCTPVIMWMVSFRSETFFDTLLQHDTANAIASTGLLVIIAGYITLKQMSRFKP